MELLGDVSHVESCFDPFGDSVSFDPFGDTVSSEIILDTMDGSLG
jgi:hypothetical protein